VKLPVKICRHKSGRNGAMLPLIAVSIVVLFVAAVLAIDIARIHVTRSELRTATDAAARAAVEALGREQTKQAAIDAALAIARANTVAGTGLNLDPSRIRFGSSVQHPDGSFSFVEGGPVLNTVSVVGERSGISPDGPVAMMFGRMFGQDSFSPVQTATATRLDRDIALVLDVSGSMGSFGRFAALDNGLNVFLSELNKTTQQERVSLTVYSTNPRKRVDLTPNLIAISDAFDDESPGGRTGIGRALRVGLDSVKKDPLARPFALKSIVLMTDGNHNEGISPDIVALECKDAGVIVHTITFSQGADKNLMKKVAEETGGTHLHADSDQQLIDAFQSIAQQLQVLLIE
jgi:Ca-activated chloride channel family protein